jgi:hypothetical protein
MGLYKLLKKYGIFGWNYWYLLTRPWKIIKESYYHTKWFIQRGYRGYSDSDVWSLSSYLLNWLPSALEQLRKNSYGYPGHLSPDSWDYILAKMIDGLKHEKKWSEMECETEEELFESRRKGADGMRLLFEYFRQLWD